MNVVKRDKLLKNKSKLKNELLRRDVANGKK